MKPNLVLPSGSSEGQQPGPSKLPALLAIVAAIVGWLVGSDWQAAVPALQQQLQTTAKLAARSAPEQLADARRSAEQLTSIRAALERRLSSGESEQLVRAKLVQLLRDRCAESLTTQCLVKLADDSLQTSTATGMQLGLQATRSDGNDSAGALEDLGIRRARALVSGGFTNDEPLRLVQALQDDMQHVWRLNGVVVRGNTFEVDVELHSRLTTPAVIR